MLHTAPIAIADEYQIEKDAILSAAAPVGVDSFATDFGDGVLGAHLEGDGFAVEDGKVHRRGASGISDRAYVRSVDGGFLNVDFRFELSLKTSNTADTAIYFIGIGRGVGNEGIGSGEPQDSLFLRIHGPTTAKGYIGVSNSPASDFDVIGSLPLPGTHRVRIDKVGNTATFSVDQDFNGAFVPDIAYVVDDLTATAPFLTDEISHLFFGTAIEQDFFDDVSVQVLSLPSVLTNDTDADGDALTAELVSGPEHGTVTLQANGTFIYRPNPGFVGTDAFRYVARDAELASQPAEVKIVVLSSNVAPAGVNDHYEIAQDTILAVTRPSGVHDFSVDFEDGTIFPHLEGVGFIAQDGVARRLGADSANDRAYLRTKQAGFLGSDFRYEVSLTTSIVNETAIYFVGIGSGKGRGSSSNGEPADSIHLRIHGPNTANGFVAIDSHPAVQPARTIGFLREPGTHRVRLEKIGNTLTFSIDEHFDGQFAADISFAVDDLAATAPFLTDATTRLFFGTAIEQDYFDDLAVASLTPVGLLANDVDADGDELTAQLLTNPTHGSVVFESNGTFTYTPSAGFVGLDSFTYRATDAEAASEPTEVTISVVSTNLPPVAVADRYQTEKGQPLNTTLLSTPELRSQRAFYANFDDSLPAEFTGTTSLANVQGYAGLGTGDNVFAGRVLRNQTGMSFPFQEEPSSPVIPTRLVLSNLPEHESVDIRFLFAAIDSWDGNTPLPDIFAVTVDGEVVFVETFDERNLSDQSYVSPLGARLAHNASLGFNQEFGDAAYDMSFEPRLRQIPHTSADITIEWFTYGEGWTAAFHEDESWGIDNVEVIVNSAGRPAPRVLANDSDANGQSITAVLETSPRHGTLSLASDGSFSYIAQEGFAGIDSFSYRASDGIAASEPAWVTIEVRADSRAVIAVGDRYDIAPDQTFVAGQQSVIGDLATGINQHVGEKLRDLALDRDYHIVGSPNGIYTGQIPTTMPGDQPIGGYLPDRGSDNSRWVGVLRNLPDDFSVEPGEYVFETTVEILPVIAAQTAFIKGLRLAADNSVFTLLVNDVPVLENMRVGFDRLTHLGDVGLGTFHPGVNVVRFHVVNDNGGRNPMGLRVEGQVVGQPTVDVDDTTGVLANDFVSKIAGVTAQVVSVGGTADPWLAGMPNGTRASLSDVSPAQSPAQAATLPLQPGDILRFEATGKVNNTHNLQLFPIRGPDGGDFLDHASGAEHGISNVHAPMNSLVGVFLNNSQPNFFAPPTTLDFRAGGNVAGGVNYTRLEPELRQVFFLGDGLTAQGQPQEIVVPAGATRLFLGTMDGFRWSDNIGRFDVHVRTSAMVPIGTKLQTGPSHGQVQLAADGGFIYTPDAGFTGVDRFTYQVSNGRGDADVASVLLRVGEIRLPGDANRDGVFDQKDIVQVLEAGRYLTGITAVWEEGDWNGDGMFDQLDVVAALQSLSTGGI